MRLQINKGYKWYRFQKEAVDKISDKQKITMVVARQQGKTELGATLMVDFMFRYANRRNPIGIICMLSQDQAYKWYFSRVDAILSKLPKSVYTKQGGKDKPIIISFHRPHFGDTAQVIITGVGNAKALRGGTCDFMILDEMASYPPGLWKSIFEPMLDRTRGKALLTSTPNGRNMFYELCKHHKENEHRDPEVGHLEYDVHTAKVHTPEWIQKKRESYQMLDRMHEYAQEYENSFTAAAETEAPFAVKVHQLAEQDRYIPDNHIVMHAMHTISVAVDIGSAGNMATWHWVTDPITGRTAVIDYTDHHVSLKSLLDDLYNQYCADNKHVHVVFPVDVNTPAISDGGTYASVVMDYISKKGYNRIMQVSHLPKVKSKPVLWRQGLEMWNRCMFHAHSCAEGLHKLAGVRFKKIAATEEIKYGETVSNGNQHAADAFLYMCAAIADKVLPIGGVLPHDVELGVRPVLPRLNKYTSHRGTVQYRRPKWR